MGQVWGPCLLQPECHRFIRCVVAVVSVHWQAIVCPRRSPRKPWAPLCPHSAWGWQWGGCLCTLRRGRASASTRPWAVAGDAQVCPLTNLASSEGLLGAGHGGCREAASATRMWGLISLEH